LGDYESVIRDGLQDILDPSVTVRAIDEKWRLDYAPALGNIGKGVGYTALIDTQKAILIAEFDYSMLSMVQKILEPLIDIVGMTDPAIIVRELRQFTDKIDKTLGGGSE